MEQFALNYACTSIMYAMHHAICRLICCWIVVTCHSQLGPWELGDVCRINKIDSFNLGRFSFMHRFVVTSSHKQDNQIKNNGNLAQCKSVTAHEQNGLKPPCDDDCSKNQRNLKLEFDHIPKIQVDNKYIYYYLNKSSLNTNFTAKSSPIRNFLNYYHFTVEFEFPKERLKSYLCNLYGIKVKLVKTWKCKNLASSCYNDGIIVKVITNFRNRGRTFVGLLDRAGIEYWLSLSTGMIYWMITCLTFTYLLIL